MAFLAFVVPKWVLQSILTLFYSVALLDTLVHTFVNDVFSYFEGFLFNNEIKVI